jgi:cytochrome P450
MKTPPSEEAFREIYNVVQKCAARPGEKVIGLALFVLTDGPEHEHVRLVVSPADAEQALLRLVHPFLEEAMGPIPPASGDAP